MAEEPGDVEFISKLDEASQKKAKEELNELNDKDRIIAVQTLRKWVKEQDWLTSPVDFEFLLRYLRVRKFSQLGARQTIENYWTGRTKCPTWYKDMDPANETMQELLKTGFFMSPKKHDRHGRRIIFIRLGKLDLDLVKMRWGLDNLYKACFLVYEWMIRDENVQVNGLCTFTDYSKVTLQFLATTWGPETAKKFLSFFQNSLPIRLKAIHFYNAPAFYDALITMMTPFLKQKLRDRIFLHGNSLVNVYDQLGMEIMPKEYLPDDYTGICAGTTQDITEEMIEDMMKPEFREYIMDISSDKYDVDEEKKKKNDSQVASFRQLNVD